MMSETENFSYREAALLLLLCLLMLSGHRSSRWLSLEKSGETSRYRRHDGGGGTDRSAAGTEDKGDACTAGSYRCVVLSRMLSWLRDEDTGRKAGPEDRGAESRLGLESCLAGKLPAAGRARPQP